MASKSDEEGAGTAPVPETADASADDLADYYRYQVLARTFDEKAVSLSRQGRVGTYAPLAGQEAAQVGAAAALSPADYCLPTYRDHAMYLVRGVPLRAVVRYLQGRGNYVDREDPADLRTFPPNVPIATHLPHAVGLGMAADYRGDDLAVLASLGDGATSEGDFHEALNFAGVFDAPVVFFCQNNGYAISTPTDRQTAAPTMAAKADAYGIEGVRVDGNDVLAVREAVGEAVARARDGEGPALVEAVTYRRGAHTTTDDPARYREEAEVEAWREDDPLARTREYLDAADGWSEADEAAVREWADERVAAAVAAAEAEPAPDPGEMFDHLYGDPPARVEDQRSRLPDDPGGELGQ